MASIQEKIQKDGTVIYYVVILLKDKYKWFRVGPSYSAAKRKRAELENQYYNGYLADPGGMLLKELVVKPIRFCKLPTTKAGVHV